MISCSVNIIKGLLMVNINIAQGEGEAGGGESVPPRVSLHVSLLSKVLNRDHNSEFTHKCRYVYGHLLPPFWGVFDRCAQTQDVYNQATRNPKYSIEETISLVNVKYVSITLSTLPGASTPPHWQDPPH